MLARASSFEDRVVLFVHGAGTPADIMGIGPIKAIPKALAMDLKERLLESSPHGVGVDSTGCC